MLFWKGWFGSAIGFRKTYDDNEKASKFEGMDPQENFLVLLYLHSAIQ